jgi:hypothetical protein
VPAFSAVDDAPHIPPGADAPAWQECWSLDWHDPAARAAAVYRIRVAQGGRTAEVRTWTLTDGSVTSRTQAPGLSAGPDAGSLRAGDLCLRVLQPLRSYAVTTGPDADLTYTAATDAFRFSMSGQRADPGGEHYESFGTVTGTLRGGSRPAEVTAQGFYRHSWGPPTVGTQLMQSVHGMFGAGLFFSIAEYRTPAGSAPLGYIFEDGEFHGVEKARFRTETDDSGLPRGCDLLIATADRRDFRILGTVTAATRNGPGFAAFVLGRHRGTGIIEGHHQR